MTGAGIHNQANGDLTGAIVQAGSIHHVSLSGPSRPELPRQLPLAIRDFIGRADHLAALNALLPQEAAKTVVITALDGAGGIGKTTLAIHWAHQAQHHFPDGTLYANLRGYGPTTPATPTEILDAFLRALGCPPERIPPTLEAQSALYRSLLSTRQILVILDNANTPAQVRPLLPGTPGCLVLITSRAALTGLVVNEGATRITLDVLPQQEAIELVSTIIGSRAHSEPEAVLELTNLCARLPLALRIAANRTSARPHISIADLAAELSDLRTRLDHLITPGDELSTVRTVLSWSDQALTSTQSRMLRLLALHPGPHISPEAAAALADISPSEARHLLENFAELHLLEPTPHNRYKFHDLLRAYATEQADKLEPPETRAAAIDRLLGWYLHACDATRNLYFLPRADAAPMPRHPLAFDTWAQAHEWQRAEFVNVIALARLAAATGRDVFAWQLPAINLYAELVPFDDLIAVYRAGLGAARKLGNRLAECHMLMKVSVAQAHYRREFAESVELQRQALDATRMLGDRQLETDVLNSIGVGLLGLGQVDEAIELHHEVLARWRKEGNEWASGIALFNLARGYQKLGKLDQAKAYFVQGEAAFIATGDRFRIAGIWQGLADIAVELGLSGDAVDLYNRALEIYREFGSLYYEVEILIGLGVARYRAGDLKQACACWERALLICGEFNYPHEEEIRAHLAKVR